MKRKTTGKRLRFEIFKRDGFRCIYCGVTPVQSILHIDHVIPVAKGGSNKPDNLVTACQSCNSGKSSVSLKERKLSKPMLTEAHREYAEQITEYLAIQRTIADAKHKATCEMANYWEKEIGPMTEDMFKRLRGILQDWSTEELIEAIDITARKLGDVGAEFNSWRANNQAKYFHGILRKWKQGAE